MKEPGHADSYQDLDVNYIPGKVPELVTFDAAGAELERIALAPYTTDALHALVSSKGFRRKEL